MQRKYPVVSKEPSIAINVQTSLSLGCKLFSSVGQNLMLHQRVENWICSNFYKLLKIMDIRVTILRYSRRPTTLRHSLTRAFRRLSTVLKICIKITESSNSVCGPYFAWAPITLTFTSRHSTVPPLNHLPTKILTSLSSRALFISNYQDFHQNPREFIPFLAHWPFESHSLSSTNWCART